MVRGLCEGFSGRSRGVWKQWENMKKWSLNHETWGISGIYSYLSWLLCGYGSIPINTIISGMNIHLPAILMFTRGTRFWHTAIYNLVNLWGWGVGSPTAGATFFWLVVVGVRWSLLIWHPKNDGFIYVYTINHMNICMNKRIGVLYWLVVWNMNFMTFPSYWEFHHPSWRSHIFQRGRYTTNQWCFIVETSSKIWIWG